MLVISTIQFSSILEKYITIYCFSRLGIKIDILTLVEDNLFTILFGFFVPIIGYFLRYRLKMRDVGNAKLHLIQLFGKMIAEEPGVLNPELIYAVIRSEERKRNLKRTISRINNVIEIFEDVQRAFVENQFIPKDERKKLLDETSKIIDKLKKFETIQVESSSSTASSYDLITIIISLVVLLPVLYMTGTTLSKITELNFPFSSISISIILITAIFGSTFVFFIIKTTTQTYVEKEKKYIAPILDELVYSAFSSTLGPEKIERNYRSRNSNFDFLINIKGKKIPVQLKLGSLLYRDVKEFYVNKQGSFSNEGILITNSMPTDNAKKFAEKNHILIFEGISNENDITNNIKKYLMENT